MRKVGHMGEEREKGTKVTKLELLNAPPKTLFTSFSFVVLIWVANRQVEPSTTSCSSSNEPKIQAQFIFKLSRFLNELSLYKRV